MTIQKKAPAKHERKYANFTFVSANDAELKALGDTKPDGYIAGWASTDGLDLYDHIVLGGAFQDSIQERGLRGPRGIKLLLDHEWSKLAGEIVVLEYRGNRLWMEAQLNLAVSYVRDRYEMAKMLGGLSFSVGFMLQDYAIKSRDKTEYLEIQKGDLYEISIVPFPGNEEAEMTFVKTGDDSPVATVAEFAKKLVSAGLVKSRNDAQRVIDLVKSSRAVFDQKDKEDEVTKSATPVLAKEKLDELGELVQKMKATLSL